MKKSMAGYFKDRRTATIPGLSRYDESLRAAQYKEFMKTPFYDFQLFVLPPLEFLALEVSKRFSKSWGRPTADLITLTGIFLMAEAFDWTVGETLRRLKSDNFVQMGLGIPENPTDNECIVSERTFCDFRKKFKEVDRPWLAALSITKHFSGVYCVKVEVVRLDSTPVRSNVKDLATRGALFQERLAFFVRECAKAYPEAERDLDPEIRNSRDRSLLVGCDPFAQAPRKAKRRLLGQMARDAAAIVGQFRFDPCANGLSSFRSLKRQLPEQCVAVPGTDCAGPAVLLKYSKEVAADSLQTPHDTGVAY
jgi:hypothetical protein